MMTSNRMTTKKKALLGAVSAALIAAGGATYAFWPRDNSKLVAQLARANDPQQIRQAVDSGQITRQEGREAFGPQREAEMDQRMDAYFALSTPKDRQKYLDKLIDEMEARRREWERRATTRPATSQPTSRPTSRPTTQQRGGGDWQQRAAARQDSTPPDKRARRVEFMAAMRARMQQRGIQPGRGGPGGWRGGGGGGGGRGGDGGRR